MQCSTWQGLASHLDDHVGQGKLFVCLLTAWELMLRGDLQSKAKRKLELSEVERSIQAQCPTFPALISQLLDKWASGIDVASLLP